MARAVAITCAAIIALVALTSCVSADTTNTRVHRYRYVSDVQGYANMTKDVCEILGLVGSDNAAALDLYYNGKNSIRGAVFRSLSSWAVAEHPGEPFFDTIMAGFDNTTLDQLFETAVNASNAAQAAVVLDAIRLKYMMHEWDAAVNKTSQGLSLDSTGAPHNLDEAYAMFAGFSDECEGATLYTTTEELSRKLNRDYFGDAIANLAMVNAFNDAQYAAQNNNTEMIQEAYDAFVAQVKTVKLQEMYAKAYVYSRLRRGCPTEAEEVRAAQETMWTIVKNLMTDRPEAGLTAMDAAVTKYSLVAVDRAAKMLLPESGIKVSDIGTINREAFADDVECSAK